MNKLLSLSLLSGLFLFSSSLSATNTFQEDMKQETPLSSMLSNSLSLIDNEAQDETLIMSNVKFETVVEALKNRQLLSIDGREFAVMKDLPKLPSSYYKDEPVSTNPCYLAGLGPTLLKIDQIKLLPQNITWLYYHHAKETVLGNTYLTLRYTANNNPDWEMQFTSQSNYWHTEYGMNTTVPIRTVNFLLKQI